MEPRVTAAVAELARKKKNYGQPTNRTNTIDRAGRDTGAQNGRSAASPAEAEPSQQRHTRQQDHQRYSNSQNRFGYVDEEIDANRRTNNRTCAKPSSDTPIHMTPDMWKHANAGSDLKHKNDRYYLHRRQDEGQAGDSQSRKSKSTVTPHECRQEYSDYAIAEGART